MASSGLLHVDVGVLYVCVEVLLSCMLRLRLIAEEPDTSQCTGPGRFAEALRFSLQ
jgi:hypothetical protein